MDRWSGKIAVVTGASSGIGAAVSVDLAKAGLIVIGLARRVERVNALSEHLIGATGTVIGHHCDVADRESVQRSFDWIDTNYGGVNILVNSAGVIIDTMILDENNEHDLDRIIDTNIKGLVYSTKAAYRHMTKYDAYGHIVHVNSILGHCVVPLAAKPMTSVYAGSKFAVTATTEVLRQELNYLQNRKVRVSSISPGLVDTELFASTGLYAAELKQMPNLKPGDVSQAILFMLSVPEHVQIHELVIKAVGEAV